MASLPIDQITIRSDARAVDAATVAAIADSIGEVGLINPIRVRKTEGGWEVVAGVHRLQAHKQLGLVEIEAVEADDDDLMAELAMIDENLCRAELSPSDRARYTARRKAIYEDLHPEARPGAVRAHAANVAMGHDVGDKLSPTFTQETSALTGKNIRSVQRDVQRGEKVLGEVLDLIRHTPLDTASYLDKLKRLPGSEQYVVAKRDLALERSKERQARKIIRVADAPLDHEEAVERQVAALMALWNKTGPEARNEFLARIDTPVFDRSAA